MVKQSINLTEKQKTILQEIVEISAASNISDVMRLLIDNAGLLLSADISIHEKSTVVSIIKHFRSK